MTSLTHRGACHHTKPMPRPQAEQFARCLQGNARFTRVSVEESRSPGKAVVYYQPASDDRYESLLAGEQERREEKARTEGQGYLFLLDEGGRFYFCMSASGEVYEVSEQACSCPDHTYRMSRIGPSMACKHRACLLSNGGSRITRPVIHGGSR